ncbi:MAG: cyclic pyranopterin monophosphate synthase MoaC [Candidatus Dormibacteraeota bacterium]|nr:cyclic pyranopterin monophosphate synthase MoaC [Candidatus Dormibacteraeota bacterium]
MGTDRLTHIDESGRARMVDVSEKAVTQRTARAAGRVLCTAEAVRLIASNATAKGNVIETARLAGIMGAKRTPDLIPLCHPLPLAHIDVEVSLDEEAPAVLIEATTRVEATTGVEMEALTAVVVAGLTVIDMVKSVDRWAVITDVRLLSKEGGRSGNLRRPSEDQRSQS